MKKSILLAIVALTALSGCQRPTQADRAVDSSLGKVSADADDLNGADVTDLTAAPEAAAPRAGAPPKTTDSSGDRLEPWIQRNDDTALWQDRRSGCWYIIYNGDRAGGITERMGRDHQQICDTPPGGLHRYKVEKNPDGDGDDSEDSNGEE